MHRFILSSILLVLPGIISSKKLPAGVTRCSKSSPEFQTCMSKSLPDGMAFFAAGYPELGIPRLEPFLVESLDLGDSNAGSVKLHQIYNNLELFGMTRNGKISNFEIDFSGDKCFWKFNAISPGVRMESDYTITGQLLVFPINGHGRCNNTLLDMDVYHEMHCERYKKKGKTHLKITSYVMEIQPKQITFFFDNIIDGNEQLSKEVLKTMNENALSVFADIRLGFQDAFGKIWRDVGNSVLSKVPEDEIFLP